MSTKVAKGLLLSGYDAGSHRYWRKGLEHYLNEYEWTVLTLPARFFSWRIRGNPISFLERYSAELSVEYDFVIATSMVDLATLKGIIPSLSRTPSLVYFHENQFEYPKTINQQASIEPQMVNLYSAMAADAIVFNSEFNRRSFFDGCDRLMAKLPDHVITNLSEQLSNKSLVIPVPVDEGLFNLPDRRDYNATEPVKLLWNHRWEYDKGPDRLLLLLLELQRRNVTFELNVVGEAFRNIPDEFKQIEHLFSGCINTFGYVDNVEEYRTLLAACDVVISTAIHEFQGIAVLEAVSAGCLPLVPDRLSYQALIPGEYRYSSHLDTPELEASEAVDKLLQLTPSPNVNFREGYRQYSWSSLIPSYRNAITSLLLK
ncbi:tRNA-queuosine alpha-mannosyltransferase domain-containing protein [Alkalimarinus coralli]|uniref:tRNA-queuosine alpha-mannosyltransferase domain-containing protein n=1 Tax=Alkalimarinus coralli TaxID=2935863 RepID=UPI00202B017F|nr:DUF3524 domain-containing protein [Alkalimarinus coralli]